MINHRYNAQLPTVITTNQRLEDLDPRLRSRLMDAVLVTNVAILAPDFRTGKNSGQSELSTLALHEAQRFETFDAMRMTRRQANVQTCATPCTPVLNLPTAHRVGWCWQAPTAAANAPGGCNC